MFKINWTPETPVFIDVETRSEVDLRQTTAEVYANHPTTDLLSVVARCGGETVILRKDKPSEESRQKLQSWSDKTWVAHNGFNFDRKIINRFLGVQPAWYDTMFTARAGGLPGGIDALGTRLLGEGKTKEGKRILELLSRGVGSPALWDKLIEYNVRDVDILEHVYHFTSDYGEPDVMTVDQIVNDRGVRVDIDYVNKLLQLWNQAGESSLKKVERLTSGKLNVTGLRSHVQMRNWCLENGLDLQSFNKDTLARLYEDPEEFFEGDVDPLVIEVLKLRQVAVRGSVGKLNRLTSLISGDRLKDSLVYHKAHTGRWAGRGVQLQNLPRGDGSLKYDGQYVWLKDGSFKKLIKDLSWDDFLHMGSLVNVDPDELLITMTRGVIIPSPGYQLACLDFSKVELVGVAWLASEENLLGLLRNNGDPYCEMASKIFNRVVTKADEHLRYIGKTVVLGCGYGMSGRAFSNYCHIKRIDLASAGTDGETCVRVFRKTYANIQKMWGNFGRALLRCVETGKTQFTNKIQISKRGNRLVATLPSGREINYWDVKIEQKIPRWNPSGPPIDTVTYLGSLGYRKDLYGAKFCENVCQGLTRDFTAGALVHSEYEGLRPVLTVHDELIAEIEDSKFKRLEEIMITLPDWGTGFPLKVEGNLKMRYSK